MNKKEQRNIVQYHHEQKRQEQKIQNESENIENLKNLAKTEIDEELKNIQSKQITEEMINNPNERDLNKIPKEKTFLDKIEILSKSDRRFKKSRFNQTKSFS